MHPSTIDLYDCTRFELTELIASWGFPPVHAARLWKGLYREGAACVETLDAIPTRLRARLAHETRLSALNTLRETRSADGATRKFLLGLHDGQRIETVLMRCRDRATVCVSSQAGCPLGCVFCATGQQGFGRNLSTGEIVAQVLHVGHALVAEGGGKRVRNIVVMGMGEPLLNYDAVLRALEILGDPGGCAIAAKRMTLSTVGVVPGIARLADEARPYSLAVSLHAATQEARAAMIPAARVWPFDSLMEACRDYTARLTRRIFFEWTLIDGVNDSPDDAYALADLVAGIPAQINLIPLNPTADYAGRHGSGETLDRFRAVLQERGLPVSIRRRRGIEIDAGCGQLAVR